MRRRFFGEDEYLFTIIADQSSVITIGGGSSTGTRYSVNVKKGDSVSWSVARTGYVTQSGTEVISGDVTKNITLVKQKFNVTVSSNVDSTITINGQSSSGVKTKTVSVEYGTNVSWSVSATGYVTQSGSFNNVTSAQAKSVSLAKQTFNVTVSSNVDSTITIAGVSFPNVKTKTVAVEYGTNVNWSVAATGYVTQSGTFSNVTSAQTKSVTLAKQTFNVTITSNVDSTITINGQSSNAVKTKTVSVEYGSNVSWSVAATGYVTQSGTFTNVTSAKSNAITLVKQTFTVTVNSNVNATITVNGQSSSGVKTKSVTVEYGSNVSWSVTATGYVDQSGTFNNVTSAQTKDVSLVLKTYNVTVTSNVNASITINGSTTNNVKTKTVAVNHGTNASWSVSATGYVTQSGTFSNVTSAQSKSVSLVKQTFTVTVKSNTSANITIGSSTSNSVTTKSATVNYGDSISWSVSKSGYDTQSGTFSNVTSNQTKNVTLVLSTYTYTVYSDIPGASVYFDGSYKGTINSSGYYQTSIQGGDTYYNVTISGGTLPSDHTSYGSATTERDTETGTDTDTTTENNFSVSPASYSYTQGGENATFSVVSNYRNGTRTRSKSRTKTRTVTPYTEYSYSRPGQKSVSRNSSVTMNAVESTYSGNSYGSWSYGSWSYGSWSSWSYGSYTRSSPLNVDSTGDVILMTSKSETGSGSSLGYSVQAHAATNESYSSISGTLTISSAQGSKNISLTQAGKPNEYVFSSQSSGLSFTSPFMEEKDVIITSSKNGSWIGYSNTSKPDWITISYINQSGTTMQTRFKTSYNSSTSTRNGTVVFTQNESGKKVNISVYQEGSQPALETVTLSILELGTSSVTIKSTKAVASALTVTIKYTIYDDSYNTYTASATMYAGNTRLIINTIGQPYTVSDITVSPTQDSTYKYETYV